MKTKLLLIVALVAGSLGIVYANQGDKWSCCAGNGDDELRLNSSGNVLMTGNLDVTGTIGATGTTALGATTVSSTLDVAGNSTFDGTMALGDGAADTLTVKGTTVIVNATEAGLRLSTSATGTAILGLDGKNNRVFIGMDAPTGAFALQVTGAVDVVGALTATSVNVDTSDALSANGANCTTGNFALGVTAAGVSECDDIDDTAVDAELGDPISSNWAYDHSVLASAHGATNANTASKIVARDFSGGFSCGSVTSSFGIGAATGAFSGAVDIAGQVTMGTAGSKSTVTVLGAASFPAALTVGGTITAGTGPNIITTAAGLIDGTKVADGVPAANIAAGSIPSDVIVSSLAYGIVDPISNIKAGSLLNTVIVSSIAYGIVDPVSNIKAGALPSTVIASSIAVNAVYAAALKSDESFVVGQIKATPPSAQTIAAESTVAADACGGLKQVTASGAVTTNTTNTFTAPAAGNAGCCMNVVNVGSENITLDTNANFVSAGAADVVLTPNDAVQVCSSGGSGKWYQVSALLAN